MFYKKLYALFLILILSLSFGILSCSKKSTETLKTGRGGIEKTKTVPLEIVGCLPVYDENHVKNDLKIAIEFNKALPSSYAEKANSLISINKIEFSRQEKADLTKLPDIRTKKPIKRARVPITFEVMGNFLTIIFPKKANLTEHYGQYQLQLKELPDIGSMVYQFNFIVPLPPGCTQMSGPYGQSLSNIEDNG